MVKEEIHNSEVLQALHNLLIYGKKLAFEGLKGKDLIEYFDYLEYLPYLMMAEEDKTDEFESYLKMICDKYNCLFIWNKFINKKSFGSAKNGF